MDIVACIVVCMLRYRWHSCIFLVYTLEIYENLSFDTSDSWGGGGCCENTCPFGVWCHALWQMWIDSL